MTTFLHKATDNLIVSSNNTITIYGATCSNATFTGALNASASSIVDLPLTSNVSFGGTPFSTTLNLIMPIGVIVIWSGTEANIPIGWALCNGSATGIPDLSGKFIRGTDGIVSNIGAIGGSATQTLTIANLPQHTHTGTTSTMNQNWEHQHLHLAGAQDDLNWTGGNPPCDGNATTGSTGNYHTTEIASTAHTHTLTTAYGNNLNSTPFSIIPPYYVLMYIIKIS